MDEHAYSFLRTYSEDDELIKANEIKVKATNPMMPETTLIVAEFDRINAILTHISGSQWDTYMSDEDVSQKDYEFIVARWAGEQWLVHREDFYRYTEGIKYLENIGGITYTEEANRPFTAEEQIEIDLNSRAFIEKY